MNILNNRKIQLIIIYIFLIILYNYKIIKIYYYLFTIEPSQSITLVTDNSERYKHITNEVKYGYFDYELIKLLDVDSPYSRDKYCYKTIKILKILSFSGYNCIERLFYKTKNKSKKNIVLLISEIVLFLSYNNFIKELYFDEVINNYEIDKFFNLLDDDKYKHYFVETLCYRIYSIKLNKKDKLIVNGLFMLLRFELNILSKIKNIFNYQLLYCFFKKINNWYIIFINEFNQ